HLQNFTATITVADEGSKVPCAVRICAAVRASPRRAHTREALAGRSATSRAHQRECEQRRGYRRRHAARRATAARCGSRGTARSDADAGVRRGACVAPPAPAAGWLTAPPPSNSAVGWLSAASRL